MSASYKRLATHLTRDTALAASAKGRNTAVIGCSAEAKQSYISRIEEIFESMDFDTACEWVESGRAFCEVSAWITGRKSAYRTVQAARTALLTKFSLTGLGTVNEMINAAAAILAGVDPSTATRGCDLLLDSVKAEVKSSYKGHEPGKNGHQITISTSQLNVSKVTVIHLINGNPALENGVSEMGWILVPTRVFRNFVKKHHGAQLERGGSIVVPLESAAAERKFSKYFHDSFASLTGALSRL